MKKIASTLREILSDETNRLSSKRIVGVICGIFLCITLYKYGVIDGDKKVSDALVETVGAVTFGCLGLSSIDKFTLRKKQQDTQPTDTQTTENV